MITAPNSRCNSDREPPRRYTDTRGTCSAFGLNRFGFVVRASCRAPWRPLAMQTLLRDLSEIGDFVEAQRRAGHQVETIVRRQFEATQVRMQRLADTVGAIQVAEATNLTNVINAGPWTQQQRASLADQVGTWSTNGRVGSASRKLQTCDHFEFYLDDAEYNGINVRSPDYVPCRSARIGIVTGKGSSIGITCASEKLSGRMAALIHWGEGCVRSQEDMRDTLAKVKLALKSNEVFNPYPHEHLLRYPPSPDQLPLAMRTFAYPSGTPPRQHSFSGLNVFLNMVKLRDAKSAKREAGTLADLRAQFRAEREPSSRAATPPPLAILDRQRSSSHGELPAGSNEPAVSNVPKLPSAQPAGEGAGEPEGTTDGAALSVVAKFEKSLLQARGGRHRG